MNNLATNNHLKCGLAIKVLSIIALVCHVLSSTGYFFYYEYNGFENELEFRLPDPIACIEILLLLTPSALFALYIFKYHCNFKAKVLVPIIFGVIPFAIAPYIWSDCLLGGLWLSIDKVVALILVACLVACILALISALKGFNKKIYTIIAMSVCLLFKATYLFCLVDVLSFYLAEHLYFSLVSFLAEFIGFISLFVSLLIFATNKNAESTSPEQKLRVLKDKLDNGMITEEEYQAQRSEIISKL